MLIAKEQRVYCAIQGFTLIELLVIVSVVTLLVTVAVPGYQSVKQYIDIQGSSRQLVAAIAVARANAINLGRPVVLCRRLSLETELCAGNKVNSSGNWGNGWLMFIDLDKNQLYSSKDQLLKTDFNIANQCTIKGRGDFLSFKSDGLLRGSGNGTFTISCGVLFQTLIVNVLGRVRYTSVVKK
ncbi:GspH/FimT family protein [Aliamphritea ceti]|uniref:GspH/FimT family protein n=1 Tax=Aliamphritea ceti TaxID=1524258 RepID=UPI0021C2F513|nr:GspH/FimT family pseudopilin [Aliamphritea ceti]